jgi:hypothetical protein
MVLELGNDDLGQGNGAEAGRCLGRPLVHAAVAQFGHAAGYPKCRRVQVEIATA